jgi:NitT/TauT family transport system ATP-binding protein
VGRRFVEAGVLEPKEIFRRQARTNLALIRQIPRDLAANPEHRISEGPILTALERSFSPDEARRQLDTAIDWGRHAELFGCDGDTGEFFLEAGEPAG